MNAQQMSRVDEKSPIASEPLIIRFMSRASGNVYDAATVDHMADMALILYTGGGTAIGAVIGGCVGSYLASQNPSLFHIFTTVPLLGLLGASVGALFIMWMLHLRELLAWDRGGFRRTYRLKE